MRSFITQYEAGKKTPKQKKLGKKKEILVYKFALDTTLASRNDYHRFNIRFDRVNYIVIGGTFDALSGFFFFCPLISRKHLFIHL